MDARPILETVARVLDEHGLEAILKIHVPMEDSFLNFSICCQTVMKVSCATSSASALSPIMR